MTKRIFELLIPEFDNSVTQIPHEPGQVAFLLGANGVGKSALMQLFFASNKDYSRWVLAHRTIWIAEDSVSISAAQKHANEDQMHKDTAVYGRIRDPYFDNRRQHALLNITQAENDQARQVRKAFITDDTAVLNSLKTIQSPLEVVNRIFSISNIPIVISINNDEQFRASKNGSELYSIKELSDGEKNALLLCAEVLTAPENVLILLDEPERHLHRSIISPLLVSLMQERKDCGFIVSTHDLELPEIHPNSTVVLVRDVKFSLTAGMKWEVDLLTSTDVIPEDIKREVLGSRRKLLFVEGVPSSMDKLLYQFLYPDYSIQSKSSCLQVERAVDGIRATAELNRLEAYGIIDSDERTPANITALAQKGVFAIPAYSVEFLYYNVETIKLMAARFEGALGIKADDIFNTVIKTAFAAFGKQRENLCAHIAEKRVRNTFMTYLPTAEAIVTGAVPITVDPAAILVDELLKFDQLMAVEDLDGLLVRYPFRQSPVIGTITKAFGVSREMYENGVRKAVQDNTPMRAHLLGLLGPVTTALVPPPLPEVPPPGTVDTTSAVV